MPAHALGARVRAEVDPLAPVPLAGEVDAREGLVEADGDVGIGLVVAQPDVEARLVLLDEGLLREERLLLAGHHEGLDVVDEGDHRPAGAEVRGHALADRLRLPDVDDAAAGVAEQVDPGLVGQRAALRCQPVLARCLDGHPGASIGGRPAPPSRVRTQTRAGRPAWLFPCHSGECSSRRCCSRAPSSPRRRARPSASAWATRTRACSTSQRSRRSRSSASATSSRGTGTRATPSRPRCAPS